MNSKEIHFMLILLLVWNHSEVIDGSSRNHPHTQPEGLKGESGLSEKAEARNHTHSSIRHKHHHRRDHEKADATATAATDSLSPVLLVAATAVMPEDSLFPKMGHGIMHHEHGRHAGKRSPNHGADGDQRGTAVSASLSRKSVGDQSLATVTSADAASSSKEYILHVPPLNPLLHLYHHHPEQQHHNHNASHRFPADYHQQQMLHYNVMRNKPSNVSLVVMQWSPPAVRVSWQFNESEHGVNLHTKFIPKKLEAFRLTYHPTNSRYRLIQEVSPLARNVTLSNLKGNTEYLLKIFPIFRNELIGAASHMIRFISPDDGMMHTDESRSRKWGYVPSSSKVNQQLASGRQKDEATIHTEEIIIVFIIIMIWMSFILLFIKKWGRIRTLEPQCFLPKELLQAVAAPDLLVPAAVAAVTAPGTAAATQSLQMNASTGSASALTGTRVNNSCAIIYNNINNSSHKQNNNLCPVSTAVSSTAARANRSQRMVNYCNGRGSRRTNSTQSLGRTSAIEAQVKRNSSKSNSSSSSESIANNRDRSWSEKNEKGERQQIVTSGCTGIQMNTGKEQLIDCTMHQEDSRSDRYDLLNDGEDWSLIKSEDDGRESLRNLLKVNTKVWRGTSCRDWHKYCDVHRDGDHLSAAGRKVFGANHEKVDFHAENDEEKARDAIRDESVDQADRRREHDEEHEDDGEGGKVGKEKILGVDRMFRSADDLMGTLLHQDRPCSLLSASIQRRHLKKEKKTHHPVSSSAAFDVKRVDKEGEVQSGT